MFLLLLSSLFAQVEPAPQPIRVHAQSLYGRDTSLETRDAEPPVYQGVWSYGIATWGFQALHVAGQAGTWIVGRTENGLKVLKLAGDSWNEVAVFDLPPDSPPKEDYNHYHWATGDVNNDGADELVTWVRDSLKLYRWTGQDFVAEARPWPETVDQMQVGDVFNTAKPVLVYCTRTEPGHPFHLCLARWEPDRVVKLWDDSARLGYLPEEPVPPDFILPVSDIMNDDVNRLLMSRRQSDMSPTRFDLLEWNDALKSLERVDSFLITGGVLHHKWYNDDDPVPCLTGGTVLSLARNHDTTFLSGLVQIHRGKCMQCEGAVLMLRRDTLVLTRPLLIGPPVDRTLLLDPDGKGLGMLAVCREPGADNFIFRFYRL